MLSAHNPALNAFRRNGKAPIVSTSWTLARRRIRMSAGIWPRDILFEAPLMVARSHDGRTRSDAASIDLPRGTQSIQRAVAVLRLLATASEAGLGLTEISTQA